MESGKGGKEGKAGAKREYRQHIAMIAQALDIRPQQVIHSIKHILKCHGRGLQDFHVSGRKIGMLQGVCFLVSILRERGQGPFYKSNNIANIYEKFSFTKIFHWNFIITNYTNGLVIDKQIGSHSPVRQFPWNDNN